MIYSMTAYARKEVKGDWGRSEERRVGKDYSRDWSSDVCSSDLYAVIL